MNLGVNTRNTAALALYRSFGFEIFGTEREYMFVDGEFHDEHRMTRTFSQTKTTDPDQRTPGMYSHFRVARPVTNLGRTEAMYGKGLGLVRLGHFEDHEGFDGVMLGEPGGSYHFEFTYCRTHPVHPSPTPEDLMVFYVPDRENWALRNASMTAAGFKTVTSLNPYWDRDGRTFEDPDGYRVVIQCASWISKAAPNS